MDFETPAARERSSSVILRSVRSRWICSPTRGGAIAAGTADAGDTPDAADAGASGAVTAGAVRGLRLLAIRGLIV